MINKKLFDLIYTDAYTYDEYPKHSNIVTHIDLDDMDINIYELAHKCKEWAWNQESYQIQSMFIHLEFKTAKELSEIPKCQAIVCNEHGKFVDFFDAKTEPEAIFQACQWILDNKGMK